MGQSTLLQIAQYALAECGFEAPSSLANSTDPADVTVKALINRVGQDIARAAQWPYMITDWTITLVDGQQDYDLPEGFLYPISDSTWNRSTRRPLAFPMTSTEWYYFKAANFIQGLNLRGRIIDRTLQIGQTVTAIQGGQTIVMPYRTECWAENADGDRIARMNSDTDVSLHDDTLHICGTRAAIKRQRGLDYMADDQEFATLLRIAMANTGGSRTVALGGRNSPYLGVNIPDGFYGGNN